MKEIKVARAISESSTTSDNTSDFIDIVKRYDVVYNNHNPDYKNVEVKMKVWSQIADEIGLSVEASKRKWKNLRDSYTKYLRSFRVGTKTSKKYQYWAHADHMEFLKPFQGPGRNSATGNGKSNDEENEFENECDFGYQVLSKATSNGGEASSQTGLSTQTVNSYTAPILTPSVAATPPSLNSPGGNVVPPPQNHNSNSNGSNCATVAPLTLNAMTPPACSSSNNGNNMLPLSLGVAGKNANAAALATLASLPLGMGGLPAFPLATLKAAAAAAGLTLPPNSALTPPNCSTASNVGCLIIEPQLFSAADNFKKELNAAAAAGAPLGLFQSLANRAQQLNGNLPALGLGDPTPPPPPPPPSSKVRRVQPSPQTAAINLSCSSSASASNCSQPSPAKTRKMSDPRYPSDWDVSAVLQANRELDANTLFFLSLARQVRAMPMKFQSLAKMRCMRIVSDIELELENFDCNGVPPPEDSGSTANLKYCTDTPPPPPADGTVMMSATSMAPEGSTEHFVYCMSPSRVESMIDISSDEESNMNGGMQVMAPSSIASTAAGAVH
ncbi:CG13204 [Drosophila busckii]|uniref:CG13204 n=1 Tax=Drosophila busckii TaxID=30019 RepID=A0A0M3QUV3_DROBS|nr:uncharacterized protein LOC108597640 [Drosophila busckii]XP_017839777.1 uncharacterized protein LOC108597640 [Drosophila busckii]ALC41283.1 CG13204 [Drosophila busckii]